MTITKVIIHPLVLLSTVDHYNRIAKDSNKRVVGVLLGEIRKGEVDVTNSFAVPFEEEDSSPHIWFLDHNFMENMGAMYKKVNGKLSEYYLEQKFRNLHDHHVIHFAQKVQICE